ncbi:MAG: transcriptional antiterminator, Rof [Candidatus Thiodiazotropha sp.]
MNEKYEPVACAHHETYQYAVMRKLMLDLCWHDEADVKHRARVLPIDVVTRDRAEFLVLKQKDGSIESVRLDRIVAACSVDGGESLLD